MSIDQTNGKEYKRYIHEMGSIYVSWWGDSENGDMRLKLLKHDQMTGWIKVVTEG